MFDYKNSGKLNYRKGHSINRIVLGLILLRKIFLSILHDNNDLGIT